MGGVCQPRGLINFVQRVMQSAVIAPNRNDLTLSEGNTTQQGLWSNSEIPSVISRAPAPLQRLRCHPSIISMGTVSALCMSHCCISQHFPKAAKMIHPIPWSWAVAHGLGKDGAAWWKGVGLAEFGTKEIFPCVSLCVWIVAAPTKGLAL